MPDPVIVGLCAAPHAGRKALFYEAIEGLKTRLDLTSFLLECDNDVRNMGFEDYYGASLKYMETDLRLRTMARSSKIDLILYGVTPFDIIAHATMNDSVNPEYNNTIKNILCQHMIKFPITMILYCEFYPIPQNRPNFDIGTKEQLRIDTNLIRQLENRDYEIIKKGSLKERVEKTISLILEKTPKT